MRILTFDIEDWYHLLEHRSTRNEKQWQNYEPRVVQNTSNILDFLAKYNQKATFFVIGWIAEQNPQLVKMIASAGHEIGIHSYGHQLIWQQSQQEFRDDLIRNISIIEQQLGKKVYKYRAPGFSIKKNNVWAFELLAEAGITTDASIFPASRAHGGMPAFPYNHPCKVTCNGITLNEFPVNYVNLARLRTVFTGGGYFRFWPYSFIKHQTDSSPYIMTYFHPRDFDFLQPRLADLGPYRRFRAYYGLQGSQQKLERWITEFNFTDLQTAENAFNWETADTVTL